MRTQHPVAPCCPVHVGTPMVLVRSDRPFLAYSLGMNQQQRYSKLRARNEREIYRCPVEGCPRVAPIPGEDDEPASSASLHPWDGHGATI